MCNNGNTEYVETIIIGAGQAGLATGYYLSREGLPHLILEAGERVGAAWRKRWDSLCLFTPARVDALPGMPYPGPAHSFPSKDEFADYLEAYAEYFGLAVRTGVRVSRLSRHGDYLIVEAGEQRFDARNVVVATGHYQAPKLPPFAGELDGSIVQLHADAYRNPSQLQDGPVLVVGAGNTGAELALETAREHETWLSGRDVGSVPFNIEGFSGRLLAPIVARVFFHQVAKATTPVGRRLHRKARHHGLPLVRTKPAHLKAAGVERVPPVAGVHQGRPQLTDGRVLEPANVIWCTGFYADFSWIDLPVFDDEGEPVHERGVVPGEPRLYFMGLLFQQAASSTQIHGVERDARHIVRNLVRERGRLPADAAATVEAAG